MIQKPLIKHLGKVEYLPTETAMKNFTATRDECTEDEFWLVEHPPVFTLGQAGLLEHLLHDSTIPVVKTGRGGQITYHGPGQVVLYMMLDLKRRGMMIREWVTRIEGAILLTLADYGINGTRKDGAPGIYIAPHQPHEGAKIAALGLKVSRSCTYHGLSFNVDMDLSPFLQINPCGYAELETVDMKLMGLMSDWNDVANTLARHLSAQWLADKSLA